MSIFQILLKPQAEVFNLSDDDSAIIAEKFSLAAFLLPPIWAITHKLWLETALIIAVLIAITVASTFIGEDAAFWLYLIFATWLAFEAPAIKAAAFKRKGYIRQGDLIASDAEQAQISWVKHRLEMASISSQGEIK